MTTKGNKTDFSKRCTREALNYLQKGFRKSKYDLLYRWLQNNNELLPTKVLLGCIFYLDASDFRESDNEVIPFLFHLS